MRFPYLAANASSASLMPRMPLTLVLDDSAIEVVGLLDTGSTISVLPYRVGLALGARWEQQRSALHLTGSLANTEARGLGLLAYHPQINAGHPVELVFAWTSSNDVPVIFGQMNFFMEFEVCFYRAAGYFEVNLRLP